MPTAQKEALKRLAMLSLYGFKPDFFTAKGSSWPGLKLVASLLFDVNQIILPLSIELVIYDPH